MRLVEKKRVTILGLGETGLASALFLKKKGYEIFVSDSQRTEALENRSARLRSEKIPVELGGHTIEKIGRCDWVLLSPGISPGSEVYQALSKKGIPRVSEIEVASWFFTGEVIAVTGTSGKTTVTTLLGRVFHAHGREIVSCGNIGNPWIGELDKPTCPNRIILEISSFQLLHTFSLRPRMGILLNLGLNHLDWHPSMEDYVAAKLRLFQHQTPEDFALIREEDRQRFFPHFPFRAKVISWEAQEAQDSNQALLYEITRIQGLDPAKTREVLSNFRGLEHRLEKVAERDGVSFVNDSKCTTLEALAWALGRSLDGKVILLAGGHAKANDFRPVRDLLSQKVRQAILYGEARELLRDNWSGAIPLSQAADLREAFQTGLKIAQAGDTILLSPACASFDQFNHYKERGEFFKKLVAEALHTTPTFLSS